MLWEGLGFLQQIGESFGIRPKANSKRVEQTGCWCLPGPKPAGPGCYLARPGQFRNRETTLLKIWIRPAVCPKSCKLECKREHKKRTTVLLSWSTNPTTNSKNQHKKKHKLEHKKSTRTPQLFCNPEHKPDHKLQKPAQEKAQTRAQKKHKNTTTVLQPRAQTRPQTPRTSTRKAQLFCDLEHKEKHKLDENFQFTAEPRIAF